MFVCYCTVKIQFFNVKIAKIGKLGIVGRERLTPDVQSFGIGGKQIKPRRNNWYNRKNCAVTATLSQIPIIRYTET